MVVTFSWFYASKQIWTHLGSSIWLKKVLYNLYRLWDDGRLMISSYWLTHVDPGFTRYYHSTCCNRLKRQLPKQEGKLHSRDPSSISQHCFFFFLYQSPKHKKKQHESITHPNWTSPTKVTKFFFICWKQTKNKGKKDFGHHKRISLQLGAGGGCVFQHQQLALHGFGFGSRRTRRIHHLGSTRDPWNVEKRIVFFDRRLEFLDVGCWLFCWIFWVGSLGWILCEVNSIFESWNDCSGN